jgi:hypothetical protein
MICGREHFPPVQLLGVKRAFGQVLGVEEPPPVNRDTPATRIIHASDIQERAQVRPEGLWHQLLAP